MSFCLIDFLHSARVFGVALKWGHVVNGDLVGNAFGVVLVNAESELDHPVDALRMKSRIFERKSRGEEGGLEEQQDKILDRLVILVGVSLLPEAVNDGVLGVDLEVFLGSHVSHGGSVS